MAKQKRHKDYNKIIQLLKSDDKANILLGIQLLKASMDARLIAEVLSGGSYIAYMICYPLVTHFQEHPQLWAAVKGQVSNYFRNEVKKWLAREILELDKITIPNFCKLANKKIKEYHKEFPKFRAKILTKHEGFGYASVRSGDNIKAGIGWSFKIEEEDIGPAERQHIEDWIAIAHHPDYLIKIQLSVQDVFPQIWLEKLAVMK